MVYTLSLSLSAVRLAGSIPVTSTVEDNMIKIDVKDKYKIMAMHYALSMGINDLLKISENIPLQDKVKIYAAIESFGKAISDLSLLVEE